ncbi:hypothetical protein DPEC_G00076000 [Dallia pectoralis]|uniref:Uncharacterized protein n=1 Tax=Dallia pectoralis TaxID=75939 RepID=A0ACC2H3H6_DALPE|nr:hypothetical protein DPEC_G00076000 [Dallia pectoralis]
MLETLSERGGDTDPPVEDDVDEESETAVDVRFLGARPGSTPCDAGGGSEIPGPWDQVALGLEAGGCHTNGDNEAHKRLSSS